MTVICVEIEEKIYNRAAEIFERSGLDVPSVIQMFLQYVVAENKVPLFMLLSQKEYCAEQAIRAMQSLSEAAPENGTADMSLDEINAEIAAARKDNGDR